jgi:flagellar biosynthesis/type III secretory pathway protein FliH
MNTTSYEKGLEKGRQEAQAMNTTSYEKGLETGLEKGLEKGREEERRAILRELVEEKFGPLSAPVQQWLQQLRAEDLTRLARAVLRAQSLRELGLED